MHRLLLCITLAVTATGAKATCPDNPTWSVAPFLQPGDQRIDYWWLIETLGQSRVTYPGGREEYLAGGLYRFTAGDQSWDAPRYRFYRDGARCIDYPQGARVDYYVLNGGRLVLINADGTRSIGLISH
ncbi:hypothetical protein [Pararhodobacter sp. CCB-MM2]|uniref:hypothetical protein n=1 Tax=Pararhodobacter sp. CCB-MM2 TaxID=1786003 RepID=UPI000833AABA|nr:hypothetical protein [Pararhodobacter sp. CCB-MM2]